MEKCSRLAEYSRFIQILNECKENEKDLAEIDQTVRKALHFVPVETVDAVFAAALVPETKADAVEHMAAIAVDAPYQEVRHGHQL